MVTASHWLQLRMFAVVGCLQLVAVQRRNLSSCWTKQAAINGSMWKPSLHGFPVPILTSVSLARFHIWLSTYWVGSILCIFWVEAHYQTHDLQIISLILLLVFSFSSWYLLKYKSFNFEEVHFISFFSFFGSYLRFMTNFHKLLCMVWDMDPN